jgi:hypothetical protein
MSIWDKIAKKKEREIIEDKNAKFDEIGYWEML